MTDEIKHHIEILRIVKPNEIDIDLYITFFINARNPVFCYVDNKIILYPPDKNQNNYYNLIIIILYFIKYFNNATRYEKRI